MGTKNHIFKALITQAKARKYPYETPLVQNDSCINKDKDALIINHPTQRKNNEIKKFLMVSLRRYFPITVNALNVIDFIVSGWFVFWKYNIMRASSIIQKINQNQNIPSTPLNFKSKDQINGPIINHKPKNAPMRPKFLLLVSWSGEISVRMA